MCRSAQEAAARRPLDVVVTVVIPTTRCGYVMWTAWPSDATVWFGPDPGSLRNSR
jgi:hypothetical protein